MQLFGFEEEDSPDHHQKLLDKLQLKLLQNKKRNPDYKLVPLFPFITHTTKSEIINPANSVRDVKPIPEKEPVKIKDS